MKFDREKLEELVRKKIDKINEETGYTPRFEVTELVDIVAEVIEESFKKRQITLDLSLE